MYITNHNWRIEELCLMLLVYQSLSKLQPQSICLSFIQKKVWIVSLKQFLGIVVSYAAHLVIVQNLINAWCFKYWDGNKPSDDNHVLSELVAPTNTNSMCLKQYFQLRCILYRTGYLSTSLSNALYAMMLVYLVLLDKLVMTPCPLYSHFRCSAKSLPYNFFWLYIYCWGNLLHLL